MPEHACVEILEITSSDSRPLFAPDDGVAIPFELQGRSSSRFAVRPSLAPRIGVDSRRVGTDGLHA